MAAVTYRLREHDDPEVNQLTDELRFYTVTLPIDDDKNVVAEEPAASVYWLQELADGLEATVRGPTLDPTRGGFRRLDDWPLLSFDPSPAYPDEDDVGRQAFYRVANPAFIDAAFAYRGDDEGDDFRRIADARLVAGVQLDADTLFEEYMQRYSDASEDGKPPSPPVVAQQLVQLETLDRAGLLADAPASITPNESTMTQSLTEADIDMTDHGAIRAARLDAFLNRSLFDATTDDGSTRRAAALAGVLIGQVSWHQEDERDIGRPLDAGTKGDQLSVDGLTTALTSALEKAKLYAFDSAYERDVLFPETVDRLLETTDEMPMDWELEKRELQFCYVLGHAHGRRSMSVAFDLKEDDGDEETEETQ